MTTANVLPGSMSAIGEDFVASDITLDLCSFDVIVGGQAFTIKLRETAERSPTAMLLEPPANINGSYRDIDPDAPLPWRQMK